MLKHSCSASTSKEVATMLKVALDCASIQQIELLDGYFLIKKGQRNSQGCYSNFLYRFEEVSSVEITQAWSKSNRVDDYGVA